MMSSEGTRMNPGSSPGEEGKAELLPLPDDLRKALTAVLGRLSHLKSNWNQALAEYFDFGGFLIALQNCITTSRTVTFILQNHKSAIPDFDSWYAPFQEKFNQDPIMKWAKLARNKIEKQGDVEMFSQVRAELVAAYTHNPKTNWVPFNVGWSSEQFRRSIPQNLLDSHVVENGALAIERRWIDVELPEHEILDALAYVYGQLALMIISLHQHCRVVIPEECPELGEHMLLNLLPDGRVPSMARPFEDRGVYIAVKDGSILGYRREFRTIDRAAAQKGTKRYGNGKSWDRVADATNLQEVAEVYFQNARAIMLKDGFHASTFVLLRDNKPIDLIFAAPQNRIDKYLLVRDIAYLVRRIGANGLIHIAEAWTASREDIPKGKFAVDAKKRGESIMLAAVDSTGKMLSLSAQIIRKKLRKHKVKQLMPTEIELGTRLVTMAPVLEVWGKLDALRLEENDEPMRWVEEHFRPNPDIRAANATHLG
jgi:hypothetical protein